MSGIVELSCGDIVQYGSMLLFDNPVDLGLEIWIVQVLDIERFPRCQSPSRSINKRLDTIVGAPHILCLDEKNDTFVFDFAV